MLKTERNMKKAPSTLMSSTSLSDLGVAGRPLSSIPPLALEQRYMFDAAGVAVGAEAAQESLAEKQAEAEGERLAEALARDAEKSRQEREQEAAERAGPSGSIIVFIDRSVEDYESLVAGLDPDVEVIYFNPDKNGLSQMAMALEGRRDIAAIHIISHGGVGELRLGDGLLTLENLGENKESLAAIRASLGDDADILLYGCNVGAGGEGRAFVEALAEALDADVAASDDLTGNQGWDGDWELETEIGAIETDVLFSEETREAFKGVLVNNYAPVFNNPDTKGAIKTIRDTGEHKLIVGDFKIHYGTNESPKTGLGGAIDNYVHEVVLTITGIKEATYEKFKIHRSNEFLSAATIDLVDDNAIKKLKNDRGGDVFTYKVEKVGNSWRITFTSAQNSGISAVNLLKNIYYTHTGSAAQITERTDGERTFKFAITDTDRKVNDKTAANPGNTMTNANLATAIITVDNEIDPEITSATIDTSSGTTFKAGDELKVKVTFNENVQVNSGSKITLKIDDKTYDATYDSGSGTNILIFKIDLPDNLEDTDGIQITAISGVTDGLNNSVKTIDTQNPQSVGGDPIIDTKAPIIDGDPAVKPEWHRAGNELQINLTFNENVKLSGGAGVDPALKLDLGGVTVYATYASGSGGKTLVFKATVPANEHIDVTKLTISDYNLQGAKLKDDAGNEFDASGLTGLKVAANIDTIAPTLDTTDSVVNPTALNTVTAGEDLQIKVKFTETVTLTGTATIQVDVGGKLVTATAAAQSGSNTLTFTVAAADLKGLKGEVTVQGGSITLSSGGLVKDKAGNAVASLALTKTALTNQTVDATVPEEPTDDEIETIENTETGVPVVKTIDAPKETDITEVSLVVKGEQEGVFFIKGEQIDEGESRLTVNGVNLKVQLKDGKLSLSRTDGSSFTPDEVKNLLQAVSFKAETPGKHGIDIVYLRGAEGNRDQVGPPILARFEVKETAPPPEVVVPTSPSPNAAIEPPAPRVSQRVAVTRPEVEVTRRGTPTVKAVATPSVAVVDLQDDVVSGIIAGIRNVVETPNNFGDEIQNTINDIRNERMTNVAGATAIRARSLISSALEPVFTREVSPVIEGGAASALPREELVINRPEARGAEEAPEQAAPTPETQPEREGSLSIEEPTEEMPVPAEQAEQVEQEQSSLDQPEGGFRESLRLAGRGESVDETKLARAMAEHRPADLA